MLCRRLLPIVLVIAGPWSAKLTWAQNIYTCVDRNGRSITADRPILECIDREQRTLNRNGVVQQVIPPSPSLEEKGQIESALRVTAEVRRRAAEDVQRDRALVLRYPHRAAHERARTQALAQIDRVMGGLHAREKSLQTRMTEIDRQLLAYANRPEQAPAPLMAQRLDTQAEIELQEHLLQQQRAERERVSRRFDDEQRHLRRLWSTATR